MPLPPLDYETPDRTPPPKDARPVFRVLAGLMGVAAGFSAMLFLPHVKEIPMMGLMALVELVFAGVLLKLAVTGRLRIGR